MATVDLGLITAAEYFLLPDPGCPTELERGVVIMTSNPGARHGLLCARIARWIGNFAETHQVGRTVTNDSGVVTEREPDTVRGPDVAYYSYLRIPQDQEMPDGYPEVAPELAFEVMSPNDKWKKVLAKVAEFLQAGVTAICVIDPASRRVSIYTGENSPRVLSDTDELTVPEVLPGFSESVAKLFAP